MGRAPCCDKASVKKGPWSPEEDAKLKEFIEKFGTGGNWIALPQKAGLKRCGKSCRLRWLNYLRPNIRHGEFSDDEDKIICSLYASIGSRWSVIASQLPGRTDNDIKNYWNTKLKKKLLVMLPSLQEKPTFFPSVSFQSPPQPSPFAALQQNHKFYSYSHSHSHSHSNPNFMTLAENSSNPLLDHLNVPNLSPAPATHLINNIDHVNDHCYGYLGFQDNPMQDYYSTNAGFPPFASTGCSSFEGGISFNKDHHEKRKQHQIKQENQVFLQGFADQSQGFMIDDHKDYMMKNQASPLNKDLEEINQININSCSLFNDGDENKTTHCYDQKGICYDY